MAGPHYVYLGNRNNIAWVRLCAFTFFCSEIFTWRCRSGILSGVHLLPDALVSSATSGKSPWYLHAGRSAWEHARVCPWRSASRFEWEAGVGRVAVDVSDDRSARNSNGGCPPDVPSKESARGSILVPRGAGHFSLGRTEGGGQERIPWKPACSVVGCAGDWVRIDLPADVYRAVWSELLASNDRERLWHRFYTEWI